MRYVGVYVCLSRGGRSERRDSELPELLFTVQAKLCFGMDNDWGRPGSRRRRRERRREDRMRIRGPSGSRKDEDRRLSCFPLAVAVYMLVVVLVVGGCGWRWWSSWWTLAEISVCTQHLRDCGLRAASNENETKRSSVCFLFQREETKRRSSAKAAACDGGQREVKSA